MAMVNPKKPKHGFSDWAWQRATAIVMVIYSLLLAVRFVVEAPRSGFDGWSAWFAPPSFRAMTLIFLWALIYHAWLGIKEILMDYVHNIGIRAKLQSLFCLVLLGDAIWAAYILWSLA
jgi:succinate dehydrogenase / fumarate reductase membrane anchor subunit